MTGSVQATAGGYRSGMAADKDSFNAAAIYPDYGTSIRISTNEMLGQELVGGPVLPAWRFANGRP